jgi:hypothetical protein
VKLRQTNNNYIKGGAIMNTENREFLKEIAKELKENPIGGIAVVAVAAFWAIVEVCKPKQLEQSKASADK